MNVVSLTDPARDSLLARVVDEYLAACRAGERPDVDALVARHADIADDLAACLASLDFLENIAAQERLLGGEGAPAGQPVPRRVEGTLGDYRILGEIGRGGMGVVYEAQQISLNRRVALKVLPFAAILDDRAKRRFQNEALAAAQLDHPHVVDVYGVGCERGVHYYAMRLIEGRSLSEIVQHLREQLEANPKYVPSSLVDLVSTSRKTAATAADASQETFNLTRNPTITPAPLPSPALKSRPKLGPQYYRSIATLGMHVAEALDHAHEQGVLHRDIKPSNLMLDSAGKAWITDFGLARLDSAASLTHTGDLLGTVRYMSPEQALAKRIPIDHRSDIYSLGITLYELLTLQPAFEGENRGELLRQVAFEEPTRPRQIDPQIPQDLETVLLKAIEKNPADRYQTATDLADDLKRFVEDRHIRARRPSFYVRASRWIKRRRGLVATAAMILFLAAAGSLGWAIDRSRRVSKATTFVNEALQDTALRRVEAQTKRDDLIAWEQASSSAQRAKALAESGPVSEVLVVQAHDLAAQLDSEHELARSHALTAGRDARMLRDLTNARLESSKTMVEGTFSSAKAHAAFRRAFFEYGIDLVNLAQEESARRIRDSSIRESLVSGLLVWASHRKKTSQDVPAPTFLLAVAASAATEFPPWHKPLIQALRDDDLAALKNLANSATASEFPPDGTICLESALQKRNDAQAALTLLRNAIKRSPGDFWLNEELGHLLEQSNPPQSTEAIRFLTAAVALRPDSPGARLNLGGALDSAGHYDEAAEAYGEAISLLPDYPEAHSNLAIVLSKQGKHDEAVAACQEAIRLRPQSAGLHSNLGICLWKQGKLDEAVAAYREAIRLQPNRSESYSNLGATLQDQGRLDEAEAACRQAIYLKPDYAESHLNLGTTLKKQGKLEAAAAAYREAIRISPKFADAHRQLAHVEQLVKQDADFDGILNGSISITASNRAQMAEFAANHKRRPEIAVKWYEQAFAEDPSLAEDVRTPRRYNAACAALLTAVGNGREAEKLEDTERARLKHQALVWLRDNLAGWEKFAESVPPPQLPQVVQILMRWQQDPDLITLRDDKLVQQLPAEDQEICRKLWADHAELVKGLGEKVSAAK